MLRHSLCATIVEVKLGTPRELPHVDRAFGKNELLGVLPQADFVVLCLPNTRDTRHIIDAAAFDAMKPTACLINVSRGAGFAQHHHHAAKERRLRRETFIGFPLFVGRRGPSL